MTMTLDSSKIPIMPEHRCICNFKFLLHLILLLHIYSNILHCYSLILSYENRKALNQFIKKTRRTIHVSQSKVASANAQFSLFVVGTFMYIVFTAWLTILLLCSDGIHPNPRPTSNSSSSVTSLSTYSSMTTTVFDSLPLNHNLSFVHYNVQSILPKLEILHAELHESDILAFSETWLNPSIDNEDIMLQQYQAPVRKDREGDAHGGGGGGGNYLCQGGYPL